MSVITWLKALGNIFLGFGTFALGIAAIWKIPEIFDVVSRIKSLDETVLEVKTAVQLKS